jgi:predicted Kef-type K+ transport protein
MVVQLFVGYSAHPDTLNMATKAILASLAVICVCSWVFVIWLHKEIQRRRRASLLIPPSSNLTPS